MKHLQFSIVMFVFCGCVSANIITVGKDSNCDFYLGTQPIQNALDFFQNGTHTQIRITADLFEENLLINKNVSIRGGYQDCYSAEQNIHSNRQTIISGNRQGTVISIREEMDFIDDIYLSNLELINGLETESSQGGGIVIEDINGLIQLDQLTIRKNAKFSHNGGGLSIDGGAVSVVLKDSIIVRNSAANGGGVSCEKSALSKLYFLGKSGVSLNRAVFNQPSNQPDAERLTGHGGGIYQTGCSVFFFSGQDPYNLLSFSLGIFNNSAQSHGGGVYLKDEAKFYYQGQKMCRTGGDECVGSTDHIGNINGNQAELDGGGVYTIRSKDFVNYDGENLFLNSVTLSNNKAGRNGGGIASYADNFLISSNHSHQSIYVPEEGDFDMVVGECASFRCSHISANVAAKFGGAIYTHSEDDQHSFISSFSHVERTYIDKNSAEKGHVLYTFNLATKTSVGFRSSVIYDNSNTQGGSYLFYSQGPANTYFQHVTIADNLRQGFVVGGENSTVGFKNSIVSENRATRVLDSNNTLRDFYFSCGIVHEDSSILFENINDYFVDVPGFLNRGDHNYQLASIASPAIDLCAQIVSPILDKDILFQQSGNDISSVPNYLGSFDAGAFEHY